MYPDVTGLALLVAGAAVVASIHLRHFGLIFLVLISPLPGLAAAFFASRYWTAPGLDYAGLAWLFGLSIGLVLADDFAVEICGGADRKAALIAVLKRRALAIVILSGVLAAAILACAVELDVLPLSAATATFAACAGLFAIAGFCLARFLPFGEAFIARTNRMRERWMRLFDRLIEVTRPRWGFAVAGIALVFAVLGGFGMKTLTVTAAWYIFPLAGVAMLAGLALAIRDWRGVLAAIPALAVPVLIGLWGLARLGVPLDIPTTVMLCFAVGIGAVPLFAAGAESGIYARNGDDAGIANSRMLMRMGPGLFFAAAAPFAGFLMAIPLLGPAGVALTVLMLFAIAGPLAVQPAFAAVIESWFPRPATIAARYRIG